MNPKIVWPHTIDKGNPFGGVDGFRNLRITFHSPSLISLPVVEQKALDTLLGLAKLDSIDAASFGGEILPKIIVEPQDTNTSNEYINLQISDADGTSDSYHLGVHKSWVSEYAVGRLLGSYSSTKEEKFVLAKKDLIEAHAHHALRRDIFITLSSFLHDQRDNLPELNIQTPTEALKTVGLYLRTKDEYEWVAEKRGNVTYRINQRQFYEYLARGILPNSWEYISGLHLQNQGDDLFKLGFSVLYRCARALQARDEITRQFFMQQSSSSEDLIMYHFDYLTLLLTSALDIEALIINQLYQLGLSPTSCSIRRNFKEKIKRDPRTKTIAELVEKENDFIEILFGLRNKIHSISLEKSFILPENYQNDLFDRIFEYDSVTHWGITKQKTIYRKNSEPPIPAFSISIDIYTLAYKLIEESLALVNSIMRETNVASFLDKANSEKIIQTPPSQLAFQIELCLLLG